jgi:hypothetical protein
MTDKYIFTPQADGIPTAPSHVKQAVAAAFARSPGLVSRSIHIAAATDLVRAAQALQFSSDKSYEECSKYLMSRDPWLALAVCAISDDDKADRALGIVIGGRANT